MIFSLNYGDMTCRQSFPKKIDGSFTIDLLNIVIYTNLSMVSDVITVLVVQGRDYSDGSGSTWWWTTPWTVIGHAVLFCFIFLLISFVCLHLIFWHIIDPSGPVPPRPVLSRSVVSRLVLMRPVLCWFLCRAKHPELSPRMAVIQVRLLPAFPGDKHLGLCQTWLWDQRSSFGCFQ